MNRKHLIAGFLMLSALSILGCGGSSSNSSNSTPMTQTQAATAFGDLLTAMEGAAGAFAFDRTTAIAQLRKEEAAGVQKAILNGVRIPVSGNAISPTPEVSPDTTTNIPTYTYACPSGGTIVVTGSYSETSTSVSANIVETPKNCQASGITMNGDPDIALSINASDNGTSTTLTLSMTGGISVGSSSCSTDLNVNATISDKTGTGSETNSGSFCGETISGNYPL